MTRAGSKSVVQRRAAVQVRRQDDPCRTNVWLDRKVFHWAHRGGGRENPSNTVLAMRAALAARAHGLELDVHRTADGILVVAHDKDLRRMTGVTGTIRKSRFHELRQLDAAYNWVPGKVDSPSLGAGERWPLRGLAENDESLRIPRLEEVFDLFPDTPLNLEIKAPDVAGPLAELLERRRHRDVIVVSFRDWRIWRFRRAAPNVPTAAGLIGIIVFWLGSRFSIALPLRRHVALQVPWRLGAKRVCDRRLVAAAHRRGMAVHIWTIDDPDVMHAAIDIGVDGIMTDRPSVLAVVLAERAVGWRPRR